MFDDYIFYTASKKLKQVATRKCFFKICALNITFFFLISTQEQNQKISQALPQLKIFAFEFCMSFPLVLQILFKNCFRSLKWIPAKPQGEPPRRAAVIKGRNP